MAILNYTTKIEPSKTIGEIQSMIARHGAQSFSTQYEDKEISALFFALPVNGQTINFRLPSNWRGVFEVIKKDYKIPRSFKDPDQAKRCAWRIVKDWVEAQLAIIESGQANITEVFMPYMINHHGQTLFQKFTENPQLLLE